MSSNLRIRTLGRFALEGPTGVLMTSSKPLAVLFLLRVAPNCELPRERLVELLWGQTPRVRGRQSLRQAVATLRSILGADALAGGEESLHLTAELAADWLEVEDAREAGDYATANRLLQRGDFLPEDDLPQEAAFRDEVRALRARLHFADGIPDAERVDRAVAGAAKEVADNVDVATGSRLSRKRMSYGVLALTAAVLFVTAAQRERTLEMTSVPIAMAADGRFVPTVELDVRGWLGRRSMFPAKIRVEVLTPGSRLLGAPDEEAIDGRVVLNNLVLGQESTVERTVRLRFSGEGVRALDVEVPTFPHGDPNRHALRIVGVRLHGRAFPPESLLPVEVGTPLELEFDVEYSSPWAAASVITAGWSSWLPSGTALSLTPLVTPALHRRTTLRALFPPIPAPGQHTLLLAFHAEGSAAHIVSLTNWTVGAPVWNDGNDFSSLTREQLTSLERAGGMTVNYLKRGGPLPEWVAAAALRVEARIY
jgi:hypothetical protein